MIKEFRKEKPGESEAKQEPQKEKGQKDESYTKMDHKEMKRDGKGHSACPLPPAVPSLTKGGRSSRKREREKGKGLIPVVIESPKVSSSL